MVMMKGRESVGALMVVGFIVALLCLANSASASNNDCFFELFGEGSS